MQTVHAPEHQLQYVALPVSRVSRVSAHGALFAYVPSAGQHLHTPQAKTVFAADRTPESRKILVHPYACLVHCQARVTKHRCSSRTVTSDSSAR